MSSSEPASVGACPTPVEVVRCGHVSYARCSKRSCAACGKLWLGDTSVKVLAACQSLTTAVALVTITAPGQDVLPWDETGRRVVPAVASAWNATAPERLRALHRVAASAAREHARWNDTTWDLIARVWEYQKRGMLHAHMVVPCGSVAERDASEEYVRVLAAYAPAYGFGFVDRGRLPKSGPRRSSRRLEAVAPHRAGAYIAGYIVSTGAGKPGVAEVAARQGVPGAVVYVAARLTRATGITMRSLRARRRIVSAFPGCDETWTSWRAACLVDNLSRRRAPLTPDTRRTLYERARDLAWTDIVDLTNRTWLSPSAAAPPARLRAVAVVGPPRRITGKVRLDPVLHHGIERNGRWEIWSEEAACR